jgi:hypothetical protein
VAPGPDDFLFRYTERVIEAITLRKNFSPCLGGKKRYIADGAVRGQAWSMGLWLRLRVVAHLMPPAHDIIRLMLKKGKRSAFSSQLSAKTKS